MVNRLTPFPYFYLLLRVNAKPKRHRRKETMFQVIQSSNRKFPCSTSVQKTRIEMYITTSYKKLFSNCIRLDQVHKQTLESLTCSLPFCNT
jgi:hypothetical protein